MFPGGKYNSMKPLGVITSTGVAKPPSLSPLCGWQKEETVSPKKASPITPTKRRNKLAAPDVDEVNRIKRELLPMCFTSDESPTKRSESTSSYSASSDTGNDDDGLLYMKVPDLKFTDLDDWAKRRHYSVTKVNPHRGLAVHKAVSGSRVEVNEELIALFRYGDCVFAIKEKCPHAGGPLHLGDIEVLPDMVCLTCPWHKWKINLNNGKVVSPPNRTEQTRTYPAQLGEDDSIWIGFDNFSAKCFNLSDTF